MKKLGFIITFIAGVLLLMASRDLPDWADPNDPVHTAETATYYITHIFEDTTVPNLVTAILADYRGYDTLFETVVVFIAGMAIFSIVGMRTDWQETVANSSRKPETEDPIVRITCRLLMPVIAIFGFYIVAHGHHSPGGGFQGGVVLGACMIMIGLAQGITRALRSVSPQRVIRLAALGVIIYAGVGVVCMLLGGNFLDYGILSQILPITPEAARSLSMLWVEIGVAFTVAFVMFGIFAQLSTGGRLKNGL